jgi:hypothetical protein
LTARCCHCGANAFLSPCQSVIRLQRGR